MILFVAAPVHASGTSHYKAAEELLSMMDMENLIQKRLLDAKYFVADYCGRCGWGAPRVYRFQRLFRF